MPVYAWDIKWLFWINRTAHSVVLDWLLTPVAQYGYWCWLVLLLVILFLDRRRGKLVMLMGIFAWGLSPYIGETLIRPLANHPRPTWVPSVGSQVHVLARVPSSFAFPSRAAALSFAVAGVIVYFYSGWKRWAALGAAAIIAYSRVYIGVDFPSDVIGGALLGILVGLGGTTLAGRWWRSSSRA